MTIVVEDGKNVSVDQSPGVTPNQQDQDRKRRLAVVSIIARVIGVSLLLFGALLDLFLATTIRP